MITFRYGFFFYWICMRVANLSLFQILINTGLQQQQQQHHQQQQHERAQQPLNRQEQNGDSQGAREQRFSPSESNRPLFVPPPKTTVRLAKDPDYGPNGKPSRGHGNGCGVNAAVSHAIASSRLGAPGEGAGARAASGPGPGPGPGGAPQNSNQAQDGNSKARRTVFFTNIPKDATYHDLVDVVRGGPLVDVWMKSSHRCASVSFVNSADAEAYFRYAKKNDIYIKGHRVGSSALILPSLSSFF